MVDAANTTGRAGTVSAEIVLGGSDFVQED